MANTGPYWHVVMPLEQQQLIDNPSMERGTAGYGTIAGGTVGTASAYQVFGAWAGSFAPTSNGTAGVRSPSFTARSGTTYTVSAYVRGAVGVPYLLGVGDTNGASLQGSTTFTGGGTFQRYSFEYTEGAGATRRVVLRKNSSNNTEAIYFDGVNVTPGPLTTYIDGQQEGCSWDGAAHVTSSRRSGQSKAGGTVVRLADLGLIVLESPGIGMPDVKNVMQGYGLQPGAQYQRSIAGVRAFTIAGLLSGTTYPGLHALRAAVIDLLKPDQVATQQPTRFLYTGAGGTVAIDGIYDGGLAYENRAGFSETAAIRMVCPDPYWRDTNDEGTALAPRVNLGSTNWLAKRDATGRWGTLGSNGTTLDVVGANVVAEIYALAYMPERNQIAIGGRFGSAGGTFSPHLAIYSPSANTFGTTTGGTVNSDVQALHVAPSGSLYIGGNFTNTAGTAYPYVCQWNGAFGTLQGGSVNQAVNGIAISSYGSVYLVGGFSQAGGTTAPRVCQWNGAFGTLQGGTFTGTPTSIALTRTEELFVGGNNIILNGTSLGGVVRWRGTFGTTPNAPASVSALRVLPNGYVLAGGSFGTAGGGTVNNVALFNSVAWQPQGGGLGTQGNTVYGIAVDTDGQQILAGNFLAVGGTSGVSLKNGFVVWNGASYIPLDIHVSVQQTNNFIALLTPDQTLYIGGAFAGTAQAASVATIVNSGKAEAYPVLTIRNTGSVAAQVYQLVNTTTGDGVYFNLSMLPGEIITLNCTPGARSFQSSQRGNIFNLFLPGSNLTSLRLLPGTNTISFFAGADAVQAALYWRPVHWSADAIGGV